MRLCEEVSRTKLLDDLETAKALGITVPSSLARADEVIE